MCWHDFALDLWFLFDTYITGLWLQILSAPTIVLFYTEQICVSKSKHIIFKKIILKRQLNGENLDLNFLLQGASLDNTSYQWNT